MQPSYHVLYKVFYSRRDGLYIILHMFFNGAVRDHVPVMRVRCLPPRPESAAPRRNLKVLVWSGILGERITQRQLGAAPRGRVKRTLACLVWELRLARILGLGMGVQEAEGIMWREKCVRCSLRRFV